MQELKLLKQRLKRDAKSAPSTMVSTSSSIAFGNQQSALNHTLNDTKLHSTIRPGLIGKERFQN